MVISASNRACVKTVRHVIQSLVLAVVQQAGKVSSVNKVGACMYTASAGRSCQQAMSSQYDHLSFWPDTYCKWI